MYNLKQVLLNLNVEVDVVRNDKVIFTEIENYDGIVYSPGPGLPEYAGDMKNIIRQFYRTKPMLGVCLGMQAIAEVFQCNLRMLDNALHGQATLIQHNKNSLFKNIPREFTVGRYHSWVVDESTLVDSLEVIASDQNQIMAIQLADFPVYGVQFHPESIMTEYGQTLIQNFINQINSKKYVTQ